MNYQLIVNWVNLWLQRLINTKTLNNLSLIGSKKVSFQVALTATVANLGLLRGLSPALIAFLALLWLAGTSGVSLAASRAPRRCQSPMPQLGVFVSGMTLFRPDF